MPSFRIALVFALVLAAAAGLEGCKRRSLMTTPGENGEAARVSATTQLWRIEVLDDSGKVVSRQDICADPALQASFTRPAPEVNGRPCLRRGEAVTADGTYSVRCNVDGQQYRVGSVTEGDLQNDFRVEMAVAAQGRAGPTFEQVRHYRRLGPCPAGWTNGDAAEPGATQVTNALSGAVRTVAAPAP